MENSIQERDYLATRRKSLLTSSDFKANYEEIKNRYYEKKILVIGGAGSIGSSFIYEIVQFHPSCIHIIDPNENGLTNLVRNLRSSNTEISKIKILTIFVIFCSKFLWYSDANGCLK